MEPSARFQKVGLRPIGFFAPGLTAPLSVFSGGVSGSGLAGHQHGLFELQPDLDDFRFLIGLAVTFCPFHDGLLK